MTLAEWLPPVTVGSTFTLLGIAKLVGLSRGIVGGANQPLAARLCGT